MKVILSADVPELGAIGDVVNVKNGYARNYLFPKKLAEPATSRNLKQLEHTKARIEAKRRREKEEAEEIAKKLENTQVRITAKVGEEERLYGSVTVSMIAQELADQGLEIEKRHIHLAEPIRSTGVFTVPVRVHTDVTAEIKVWVVPEEEPKEAE
ncbi:MAG: 50S ribosomal protein L9 [Alphaproteobacteria bacterium]